MRRFTSLTARLSILFGVVMISTWLTACFLLIQALGAYFAKQEDADIQGKLQLATNFLQMEFNRNTPDWHILNKQIDDALAGHQGIYILIHDPQKKILVDSHPRTSQKPLAIFSFDDTDTETKIKEWTEQGKSFRSIATQISLNADIRKTGSIPFVINVTMDITDHQHFIHQMKLWLYWFTAGLVLVSIFLAWAATRLGLKPLRDMAVLASNVTAHKLDQRFALSQTPIELHTPLNAFNTMLDRLELSFQKLSEFSSDIAHELRTPLSNMMMQTQVALSKTRTADEYREVLFSNLEEFERLARMISDMLFLAKSEHGLLTLKKDILELGHDLDELLEFFEPLASENKMELIRQGDGQLMGDRAMLRRAFSNLISNAIRYTPAGSRIIIRIKTDEDGVQVDVINPGKPIPEEQLSRIFDRFYRADAARTHHSEGAGLGLAITRSIIKAHGGFLSAKSTEYETIFSATFPHHNDEPD